MPTTKPTQNYDVAIIGAGISGVNAAYRVQTTLQHLSYTILEARDVIGGTWSFFKYPGIRSDSEISTFAFAWAPWDEDKVLADGPSILRYLTATAKQYGIDEKIQFNTKVTAMDWRDEEQRWLLTTTPSHDLSSNTSTKTKTNTIRARFVIMSTGYYDYESAYNAPIPALSTYTGQTIHPQFWPATLNYSNKKVVIIGSGATSATLFPSLSKQARHVTILQRSPSYFLVQPGKDIIDDLARRYLPSKTAYTLIRIKGLVIAFLFVQFCYLLPGLAARVLRWGIKGQLPPGYPIDEHFAPKYPPFQQRLCITPDGDFFRTIRDGKGDVVTGEIESIHDRTIVLKNGAKIEDVDIIVTATGLKLHIIGGIKPSIDGQQLDIASKFTWRNTCLEGVPNMCFMMGYIDNAWTLGSDTSSRLFVRLIRNLEENGGTSFVPEVGVDERKGLVETPMIPLSSGYIQRMKDLIPKTATTAPWRPRWHYFEDSWIAGYGSLERGMKIVRVST